MRSASFPILLALFGGLLTVGTSTAHADTRVHYLYNDSCGSPVAAANDQGQVLWRKHYRPFGAEVELTGDTIEAVADDRGFTGHTYDRASGLVYMGARYYNPQLGIFYGTDPAPVAAAVPLTFNRYIYANQNPYGHIDPDGRTPVPILLGVAFGVAESTLDAAGAVSSWLGCAAGEGHECLPALMSTFDFAMGPNPIGDIPQAISLASGRKQQSLVRIQRQVSSYFGCFVAGTEVQTADGPIFIEDIRVGDRVETVVAGRTHSSDTRWVRIDAVLPASDNVDSRTHISLLKPELAYPDVERISRGSSIRIALPELNIDGLAQVEQIQRSINVSNSSGRLVLATVSKLSNDVYELSFDGVEEPLRGTGAHPLYSLDRDDWVRVRDLQVGEQLQTTEGAVTIEALEKVRGVHRVYNLEVEGDHEYLVGEAGVRAHNNKVRPGSPPARFNSKTNRWHGPDGRFSKPPTAQEMRDWGTSQGWTKTHTTPAGFETWSDASGVRRMKLKPASTAPGLQAGSQQPRVTIWDAGGQRVDGFSRPVTKRSVTAHAPLADTP